MTSYRNEVGDIAGREGATVRTGPFELGGSSPIRVISRFNLESDSVSSLMEIMEERVKKDTPPEILEIPFTGEGFNSKFGAFKTQLVSETQRLSLWVTFNKGQVPDRIEFHADCYGYRCPESFDEQELARLAEVCRLHNVPLAVWSHSTENLLQLISRLKGTSFPVLAGLEGREATSNVQATRLLAAGLKKLKMATPLLLSTEAGEGLVGSSVVAGSLLCDGIGDAVRLLGGALTHQGLDFSYNFLQGTGNRITKTEYVSCPSCGRTLFDLQSTTERIRSKTGHLKGVKIAIMGCIVNGPGEMADADFGYVGGGPGKINLYVGKQCVEKSIPTEIADEKLISLIKTHGKWVNPT
jgi:hypothetical protein